MKEAVDLRPREAMLLKERRKALRALLRRPLITANNDTSGVFGLIRKHQQEINHFLSRGPGWILYVDRETARLRKHPVDLKDASRGAVQGDQSFDRRKYALFCLALAALGQNEKQTTLKRLFDQIILLSNTDPRLIEAGLDLDPTNRVHRKQLVSAVNMMVELGLLKFIDGSQEAYLNDRGDVLLTVNRSALAWVLNIRRSPTTIEDTGLHQRMKALIEEEAAPTVDGRNLRIRRFLYRKLLDDPVLYYADLDEESLRYLNSQRHKILGEIEAATGLYHEIRKEGIAMVDDDGEMTDYDIPREGTEGHITLLVAEYLGDLLKDKKQKQIGMESLKRHMRVKLEQYGKNWKKAASEPETFNALLKRAVNRLEALNLIRFQDKEIQPLPAVCRYLIKDPKISGGDNF